MLWKGKGSVCKTRVKVEVVLSSLLLWNRVWVWSCATRVRGTELSVSYIPIDTASYKTTDYVCIW